MDKAIALIFVLFVFLNEFVLRLSVGAGVTMYLILMSAGLFLLSREDDINDIGKMIIAFLAVPLVRIAGLFVDIPYIWKILLGGGILLFLGLYYLYKFDIYIGDVSKNLWMIFLVFCVGLLFGILGNIYIGYEHDLALIMVLPFVVFGEEIFFRGVMQNTVEKSCGFTFSLIVPALIYAALSSYLGIGLAIFFFFVSLFSGLLYASTRNVFLSITLNLVVSAFIFVVPNLI